MFNNNHYFTHKTKMTGRRLAYMILGLTTLMYFGCGTLGGFDKIDFPVTKGNLVKAIDSLYARNPKYVIPEKWKKYNDWNERGYGFLDTRIFYFDADPEEMYYVSFVGEDDSIHNSIKQATIAIRSVFNVNSNWMLEENIKKPEKERIIKRFQNEIVSKLEKFTNTKSY